MSHICIGIVIRQAFILQRKITMRLIIILVFPLLLIASVLGATGTPTSKKPKKDSAKPTYKAHLRTAIGYGIKPIANSKQLNTYVKKNKLSNAKCNKGCTINKLTHSKAYLVPKANKVLNEIAKTFYTKTKSSFTVTSITRTLADQHRLRQVNNNAKNGLSSHNFGCSYDISYIRFNGKKSPNTKLEKALENILIQYQREGKIYYIKEKWQSCFHVTVRS